MGKKPQCHDDREEPPPSGRRPSGNIAKRDVEAMAEDLVKFHTLFQDLFVRREQREWSEFYLRGQLSELERKTAEPMVLQLKGADTAAVRTLQQFLSLGTWNDDPILWRLEELIAEDLGEADASVILDGSGFPKQGTHSVGVARQYCGHLGKIANCQHAVFAAYTSSRGYAFLDRRLYMPEKWFDEAHTSLRTRYGVPDELQFTTEPQLGLAMVKGLLARGKIPFRWVLADETYGADPKFLDGIEALGKWYFVEVPVSTMLWVGAVEVEAAGQGPMGRPRKHARVAAETAPRQEARATAAGLPKRAWRRYRIKEGAKGAVEAEFAFIRVTRSTKGGRPGAAATLVLRRSLEGGTVKVLLTNAPGSCPKMRLARLSGQRWPIETAFEEAKGEVGMDHYEVRTWRGWHHHMTQTFLAYYFLVRMRLRGKKSGADTAAGETAAVGSAAGKEPHGRTRHRNHHLPPGTELRSLSLTSPSNRRPSPEAPKAA
jgi:SRSO17 transposase